MSFRTDRPWTRPLLLAVFFLSGASGLVYEIAWMRRLTHVFGSTTLAVSTVLAAFMGGFALGAHRFGRSADRRPDRALAVYGLLEIGIAGAALAVPFVLGLAESIYLALAPALEPIPRLSLFVEFLLAVVVLVVPTALMGGTLPLLARWLVRHPEDVRTRVSSLYAANTLGAGAGTAAATYVLLPSLGVLQSERLAAAANLVAGIAALAIHRQGRLAGTADEANTSAAEPAAILPAQRVANRHRALLIGIALSGLAAMIDEVAWSRVLALVLGSSVYSFGVMLLVFLVGLSIGSAIFARLRKADSATVFGLAQAANAAAALAAIALVPRLPELFLVGFPAVRQSFLLLQLWNLVLAAGLLLPSAILFGVAFPAAVAATTDHAATGAGVGRVTVANTLGTVLGAFAGGFVLIPQLGLRATLTTAALAVAVAAFLAAREIETRRLSRAVLIGAAAALGAALFVPAWPLTLLTMGAAFYAPTYPTPRALRAAASQVRLVFYKDGVATTLSVDQSGEYRYYRSNGKTDASTHPGDMANQLLLGHLPMLLHPDPRDVFVLGLGTGASAATIARYPVHSIEIVDIESASRDATRAFAAENRDILSDPRVHFTVGDGRHVLLSRRRLYDVILSDPSDVWVAGVGNLLTREFYSIARSRLRPQGVMVQWFHLHSLPTDELKLLVATFQSVFPHTTLWRPNRGDVILTGTVDPLPWDYARLSQRVEQVPGVSADMEAMGLWHPLAIFAPFALEGDDLKRLIAGVNGVHTDDRPILEYLSPRWAYVDTTTLNDEEEQRFQTVLIPPMAGFDADREITPRVAYLLGFGHASLGRTDSAIRLMEDAVAREPGNAKFWIGLGNQYRVKDQRTRAADAYRRALALAAGEPEASDDLASLLRAEGNDGGAETILREALARSPQNPTLVAAMARLLFDTGRAGEVAPMVAPLSERQPQSADLHLFLGLSYASTGRRLEAERELRTACALSPNDASVLRAAGKAFLQMASVPEAEGALSRADLLEPYNPETLSALVDVARRKGDAAAERRAQEREAVAEELAKSR